jgi:hypothetical protein
MDLRSSSGLRVGAVTCLLALAANGCSFLFAEGPPPKHREMLYFDCPTSYGFPVVDTAIAVSGGLLSLAIIALATNPVTLEAINVTGARAPGTAQVSAGGTIALVAIPLVLVGLPGTSAVYGYQKVGDCRDAKAELAARMNAAPAAAPPPGPYEPPATP